MKKRLRPVNAFSLISLIILMSLLLVPPGQADPGWTDLTCPRKCRGSSLALDQGRDVLYAGSWATYPDEEGVWRCASPDGSPNWKKMGGPKDGTGHLYNIVAMEHDHAHNVLYAACNAFFLEYAYRINPVCRCTNPDSSSSWRDISKQWFRDCYALAYDAVHNKLYVGTENGVWRCSNPNTSPSWKNLESDPFNDLAITSLAYDSSHNILYGGTSGGAVRRYSSPNTSPSRKDMAATPLANKTIWSLAYDSSHNKLYAGTDGRGVWRCANPNTSPSWKTTRGGLRGYVITSLALDTSMNRLYAGTWNGHGVWSCANPDTAPSWNSIGGGQVSDEDISSIVFDPSRNTLYADTDQNGVWRYSAAGTGPTCYLAEGSTDWGFSTYISIENPNPSAVTARITYMTKSGPRTRADVPLPAMSQATINPADDLGATDFSTKVECLDGKPLAVDRTMIWTGEGASSPEAHCSVGVTSPSATWYLPEGSSSWGFDCWLLIQNPNDAEASCDITYMIEGEDAQTFTKKVERNSRATFNMSSDIGAKDASIKISADRPVIPERAMYRNAKREGHDSIGTTSPASDFFLAEGSSAWGFTTYVLVQNPNSSKTDVTITYMTDTGPVPQEPFSMEANSRKTIRVNDLLQNRDFSTHVHGSKPIIAERAMYWGAGADEVCHDSIGMSAPHSTFYLPDGQTSDGRETWTLVQNPNSTDVEVEIAYLTPDGAGNQVFTDTVPKNSRKTYSMADKGISGRAAVMVTSKTSGKKIMVERAMYWNSRGAGTDTIGGFSD